MEELFTYPEGWEKMKENMDFLPEEARDGFLSGYLSIAFLVW